MLERSTPRWLPAALAAALTAGLLTVAPPGADAAEQIGTPLPGPVSIVGANGGTASANKTLLGMSSSGTLRHLEGRFVDGEATTVVMEIDPESGEQSYLTTSATADANNFFQGDDDGDIMLRAVAADSGQELDLQRLPASTSSQLPVANANGARVGLGGAVFIEANGVQTVKTWSGSGEPATLYTVPDGFSVSTLAASDDTVVVVQRTNATGDMAFIDITSGSAVPITDLGTTNASFPTTADGILTWRTFGKLLGCEIDDCATPTELWVMPEDSFNEIGDVAIAGDDILWLTRGEGLNIGELWRSTSLSVPTKPFFTEQGPFVQVETDGSNAFILVSTTMIRQVPLADTSAVRTVSGPGFGRPVTTKNPQADGNKLAYEADRRVEFGIDQRAGNLEDIVTQTLASGGLLPTNLMDTNGTAARFGGQPGFVGNDVYWLDRRRCGPDSTCLTIADVFRSGFGATVADTQISSDDTATSPQLDTGGDAAAWPCVDQTEPEPRTYKICHTTGGAITAYDRGISFLTHVSVEGRYVAFDKNNRQYVFDTQTGNEAEIATQLGSLETDISGTKVLHVVRGSNFGDPQFVTVTDFSSLPTAACDPTCVLTGNPPLDSWETATGTASITIDGDNVAWTRGDDNTFASFTTFWATIGGGDPRPLPAATPALFDLDIESNRLFGTLYRTARADEFDPSADVAAIALPGGAAIPVDTSAPATATGFGASRRSASRAAGGSQALSWTNPTDADFLEVRILRVRGGTPVTSLGDTKATIVYQGKGTSTSDALVAGGTTYAYSLFAVDTSGNVSPAATLVATPGGGVGPGDGDAGAFRIAGEDRFETAVKTSQQHFPDPVATVFLATGRNFPDALAASASAGSEGSPILLTEPATLPDITRDELVRLKPSTVVVMGGDVAVSKAVRDAVLAALGPQTTLVLYAGTNRFDTAAQLAKDRFPVGVGIAYVATGRNFPDALAGGLAAALNDAPILLVEKDRVPDETAAVLTALKPGRIVVLGGEVAVGKDVADALAAFTQGSVDRIAGDNRYLTAVDVVTSVFPAGATAPSVYLATGVGFPDALAGGPAAARVGAPLLLTPPTGTVPAEVLGEIDRLGADRIVVLGGEVAVTKPVFDQLANAL